LPIKRIHLARPPAAAPGSRPPATPPRPRRPAARAGAAGQGGGSPRPGGWPAAGTDGVGQRIGGLLLLRSEEVIQNPTSFARASFAKRSFVLLHGICSAQSDNRLSKKDRRKDRRLNPAASPSLPPSKMFPRLRRGQPSKHPVQHTLPLLASLLSPLPLYPCPPCTRFIYLSAQGRLSDPYVLRRRRERIPMTVNEAPPSPSLHPASRRPARPACQRARHRRPAGRAHSISPVSSGGVLFYNGFVSMSAEWRASTSSSSNCSIRSWRSGWRRSLEPRH
jgi:hypothetical protein